MGLLAEIMSSVHVKLGKVEASEASMRDGLTSLNERSDEQGRKINLFKSKPTTFL